jgi:integrase
MKAKKAKKELPEVKGIYRQKDSTNYWVRWSVDGKQRRVSLGTSDLSQAINEAKRVKAEWVEKSKIEDWDIAVEKFLAAKIKNGKFRKFTLVNSKYKLEVFRKWGGFKSPREITQKTMNAWYKFWQDKTKPLKDRNGNPALDANGKVILIDGSECTARTYVKAILSFCKFNNLHFRMEYTGTLEIRKTTVDSWIVEKLIGGCGREKTPNDDYQGEYNPEMEFILYCGFYCGMRRSEITMARPDWIKLNGEHGSKIVIPKYDPYSNWYPKSKREREIPMIEKFYDFMAFRWKDWQEEGRPFIIAPQNCTPEHLKRLYRYDFKHPFRNHLEKYGNFETMKVPPNIHSMRHTYITRLLEDGIPLSVVAALAGDLEATIESNYKHVKGNPIDIAAALSSIRSIRQKN